jgi:hypothetical protein
VTDTIGGAHMYNGYNVEFVNDRFGNPNSAIRFTEGYYQIPPGVYFNGDFTISVWYKPINTLYSGTIMTFGNIGSDNIQLINSDKLNFHIHVMNYYSTIETSNRLTIGQWAHLGITSSENNCSFYINGLLIVQTNDMYIPRNINRTSNYIGRSGEYYNLWADLDDLRIYNRSMSQAEINALFLQQLKTGSSNLLRYIEFIKDKYHQKIIFEFKFFYILY